MKRLLLALLLVPAISFGQSVTQTKYVIRFTNTGSQAATIGARFSYRDLQP